jgi:hypothetical protein
MYRNMAERGVRLGQPVRCLPQADGWGGTIRLSLSMPLITELQAMDDMSLHARLTRDMEQVGDAMLAAAQDVLGSSLVA